MSIPPYNQNLSNFPSNNQPPGGYYSAQPPKKSGNGWKIAGFGCLGLLLIAVVGSVLFVRSVKNNFAHPNKNSFVGIGVLLADADADAAHISQAVVAYHARHGKYPQALTALSAEGGFDGALLHNQLDPTLDPKHVSWQYTPPPEGAPETTPILSEIYDVMPGQHDGSGKIVISLNGKSHHE